ncbi:MAG: mannose-1-phosphate guanylyltransferase [Clostridia bacterium]|nr:mannose-1-phosphate guanylyltransferase [Clostridia bacterium]
MILAGGKGSRLWPISTTNKPKQYLNLYSDNIMINETIKRIENLFEYDNVFVITSIEQKELAERYVDYKIPRENIIYEPMSKSTAMCIFYASIKILNQKGNGTMTILSSDHYISQPEKLLKNIKEGISLATIDENLVTIGIKPTYPATGFGYIKYNYEDNLKCNIVEEFKEKPVYKKAQEYLESGKYYWNSGMFIWKISTILNNFQKFLPQIYRYKDEIINGFRNNTNILKDVYQKVESISIDKGILERASNIKMIKGEFEWLDIGSINDFFKIQEKDQNANTIKGNSVIEDVEHCNIYNNDNNIMIAIVGTKGLNIVKSNNVLLIAEQEKMIKLPNLIKKIQENKELEKYL